jgi:hypothetical protein
MFNAGSGERSALIANAAKFIEGSLVERSFMGESDKLYDARKQSWAIGRANGPQEHSVFAFQTGLLNAKHAFICELKVSSICLGGRGDLDCDAIGICQGTAVLDRKW